MESLEATQASINVALARSVMDMQANMAAALVSGTIQHSNEAASRNAGLAAEGIGTRINTTA